LTHSPSRASVRVGEYLKRARLARGLAQAEVATALRVNRVTVSNWERGATLPGDEHFSQLAKLYEVLETELRFGPGGRDLELSPTFISRLVRGHFNRLDPGNDLPSEMQAWMSTFLAYLSTELGAAPVEMATAQAFVMSPDTVAFFLDPEVNPRRLGQKGMVRPYLEALQRASQVVARELARRRPDRAGAADLLVKESEAWLNGQHMPASAALTPKLSSTRTQPVRPESGKARVPRARK
jgi:transcriptional regulator with XRE-family HTH domain